MPRRRVRQLLVGVILGVIVVLGAGVAAFLATRRSGTEPSRRTGPVLVLGGSLNAQLAQALRAAGVDVADRTDLTVLAGSRPLYDWRDEWAHVVATKHPATVVVSAAELGRACRGPCSPLRASVRTKRVRAALELFADVPTVVWVGYPAVRPGVGTTRVRGDVTAQLRRLNRIDAETVKRAGRQYVDPDRLLGGYQETRQGPDGLWYQARRGDGLHYCPVSVAVVADAVLRALGQRPSDAAWVHHYWWDHPLFTGRGFGGTPCRLAPLAETTLSEAASTPTTLDPAGDSGGGGSSTALLP